MIRPLSTHVFLKQVPAPQCSPGGIVLIESESLKQESWEHVVTHCGSKVPFDLQPGMCVVVDPRLPNCRAFEYQGQWFKTMRWQDVPMIVGVTDSADRDPYAEGCDAAHTGKSAANCPYKFELPDGEKWMAGYCDNGGQD